MEDLSPSPNVTPASIPSSVARPLALCAAAADATVDASATAKAAVAMGLNARAGLDPRNDGRSGLVCVTIDVNSPLRVSIWRVPTARASGQEGGIYRAASGESCANHALTSSLLLLAGFAEAGFRTAYLAGRRPRRRPTAATNTPSTVGSDIPCPTAAAEVSRRGINASDDDVRFQLVVLASAKVRAWERIEHSHKLPLQSPSG